MAKGIRGKDVYKIKRLNEKSIVIIFNNGRKLLLEFLSSSPFIKNTNILRNL